MYGYSLGGWEHASGGAALANGGGLFSLTGFLESMFDEIDYGLAVLGCDASIVLMNQLARDELEREKWVRQSGQRLTGCDAVSASRIDQALRAVQRDRRSLISLEAQDGCLALSFVPLPAVSHPAVLRLKGPAALVTFGKRSASNPLTLRMFGESCGLSGAEHELLPFVSRGMSAEAMAEQQHVAVSTVRSQLVSIRAKTGAASVCELMARLTTLPPARPASKPGASSVRPGAALAFHRKRPQYRGL